MRSIQTSQLLAPVLIMVLFCAVLVGTERLAFRDVSHFYTPLYDYVGKRCSVQWLPLWNPLDHTGMPLAGETSTAVLYPIRYAIYQLPISGQVAIAWYVVAHLILASFSASIAARLSGAGRQAATAAGILYPLSGSILFLYSNPPFLVGASWMPLALAILISKQPIRFRIRATVSAIAMAMMILGGDPHIALHTVIMAGAVLAIRFLRQRSVPSSASAAAFAVLLAASLSAPQIAASWDWSRQSSRVAKGDNGSLFAPPVIDDQRHESYSYSLPPWHALEMLTPSAFGSLLPVYRRLSVVIPGDGRIWTPSLYMGILCAIALIDRIARRPPRSDPWLAITILAFFLACGHFGIAWLLQSATGRLANFDSAIGGPYWWLYQFFPGYDSLRYPAKWLPFVSLGGAIITARWLGRARWRQCRHVFAGLFVFLSIGFVLVSLLRFDLKALLRLGHGVSDEFWGPLDVAGGMAEIQHSIIHSMVVLLLIVAMAALADRFRISRRRIIFAFMVTSLIELGIFGHGMVCTVNTSAEQILLSTARPRQHATRWMRTQSDGGWPSQWKRTIDSNRLLEVEASQRLALFGRWHLVTEDAVFNSMVSIQSQAMTEFWEQAHNETGTISASAKEEYWNDKRRSLSIDGVIHCTSNTNPVSVPGMEAKLIDFSSVVTAQSDPAIISINDAVTTTVDLDNAGWYRRAVYQDGNWTAQYRGDDAQSWTPIEVKAVDRIAQRVFLPAGRWHVRFVYRPWWLWPSTVLASIGWIAVAFLLFGQSSRLRRG